MNSKERSGVYSVAGIYGLRMLGLFMILPVFSLYAEHLSEVTPMLIGLAIGIYGLTQAVFQIPFGMLSDRIGRKPVIYIGLLIFAAGSVVAATSDSIFGVILGRALQGGGAIASVLMALTADLTREEVRLKAMAIIGMTIGVSFAVSLVIGPIINEWVGVRGIFWLTALSALGGIVWVKYRVPIPAHCRFHRDTEPVPSQFRMVLKDTQLLRLDLGVLILHMILTASFLVLPLILRDYAHLDKSQHWMLYLPVLVSAMIIMIPMIILAESKRLLKHIFLGAILCVVLCQLALTYFYHSALAIGFILFGFFAAFNVLEASLPSLVAKTCPPDRKGTAMGLFSTHQFFGAFLGGVLGGWMLNHTGAIGVFYFCSLSAAVWLLFATTMQNPRYLMSYMLNIGPIDASKVQTMVVKLTQVNGVAEAIIVPEDGIAYLKVDLHALDVDALAHYSISDIN